MLCFTGIFSHCTFVFKLVLWLIPGTRTIRREADKTNSGTYRLSNVSVIMDGEKRSGWFTIRIEAVVRSKSQFQRCFDSRSILEFPEVAEIAKLRLKNACM